MELQNSTDLRAIRGYAIIAKGDTITQLDENTFAVPSQHGNGLYQVTRLDSGWACTCPDHVYRKVECKHICAVKFWLMLRERLSRSQDSVKCKWCGSISIIKYGHEAGKQVYKCRSCDSKFVLDDGFKRLKYDPKIITATLDLYFKGVSLRKISDHLRQFYGLNINFSTLYKWIKRYVEVMEKYVNSLVPEISGTLYADEMMVKVGGKWKWLWSIMDEDTRFLLASQISTNREINDARRLFQKAKERLKGQRVEEVVTDGLRAYQDAFKKEFFTLRKPRTEHIRHVRLAGEINDNLIERFQGTRRERDKVLRGMKIDEAPIREGFDIYYNFIRPHMALNGGTPSEKANINLSLDQNRWLSLLRQSLNHRQINTEKKHP